MALPGPAAGSSLCRHLVDLVLIRHDAGTQQEGEQQLVLLEKAAADVAVQAVGQVAVDVGNALLQVVCRAEVRAATCWPGPAQLPEYTGRPGHPLGAFALPGKRALGGGRAGGVLL